MRHYINIVEGILIEAPDYLGMFNDLMAALPDGIDAEKVRNDVRDAVADARRILKRSDRIVWFLRLYKLGLAADLARSYRGVGGEAFQDYVDRAKRQYERKSGWGSVDGEARDAFNKAKLLGDLGHFLSLPIPSIEARPFGYDLIDTILSEFKAAEKDWQDRAKRFIPVSRDDDVVMDFGKFAWVHLDRPTCEIEGDAMGHCGNAGGQEGETILSLRERITQDGKAFWKPWATFILDENGLLGEMKGPHNQKPNKRFHPLIVALLKSDMVEGIKGGGYAPEMNFALSDLDPDTRDTLIAEKPALVDLQAHVRENGLDALARSIIARRLKQVGSESYGIHRHYALVQKFANLAALVQALGTDAAKALLKASQGGEPEPAKNEAARIAATFSYLPFGTIAALSAYVEETYPTEFDEADFREIYGAPPVLKTEAILEILEGQDDPYWRDMQTAFRAARKAGYRNQALTQLKAAIDRYRSGDVYLMQPVEKAGDFDADKPFYAAIHIENLLALINDTSRLKRRAVTWAVEPLDARMPDFSSIEEFKAIDRFLDKNPELRDQKAA